MFMNDVEVDVEVVEKCLLISLCFGLLLFSVSSFFEYKAAVEVCSECRCPQLTFFGNASVNVSNGSINIEVSPVVFSRINRVNQSLSGVVA